MRRTVPQQLAIKLRQHFEISDVVAQLVYSTLPVHLCTMQRYSNLDLKVEANILVSIFSLTEPRPFVDIMYILLVERQLFETRPLLLCLRCPLLHASLSKCWVIIPVRDESKQHGSHRNYKQAASSWMSNFFCWLFFLALFCLWKETIGRRSLMRRWNWPYDHNLCCPSQTYFKKSRWNSEHLENAAWWIAFLWHFSWRIDIFSHFCVWLFSSTTTSQKTNSVKCTWGFFLHIEDGHCSEKCFFCQARNTFSPSIFLAKVFSLPLPGLCASTPTPFQLTQNASASVNSSKQPPLPICTALAPSGCLHTVHKPLLLASKVTKGTSPPVSPRSWFNPAVSRSASFLARPSLLGGKLLTALPCPDSSAPASTWTRLPSGALVAK